MEEKIFFYAFVNFKFYKGVGKLFIFYIEYNHERSMQKVNKKADNFLEIERDVMWEAGEQYEVDFNLIRVILRGGYTVGMDEILRGVAKAKESELSKYEHSLEARKAYDNIYHKLREEMEIIRI